MSEFARLVALARLRLEMRRLERPLTERDRVPWFLFLGSLALYWTIGQAIQEFHGHDVDNYFFNADCTRVLGDLTRSHRQASSGVAVSSAHPLFLILLNPVASALARALGGAELFASLLLCHLTVAFSNVALYWTLRRLNVERWLATIAAACLMVSTTQLVFGSIAETYAFVAGALALCLLVGISTTGPVRSALTFVLPFGLNVVLLPYSLLAAPALWIGRLSPWRWLGRTLVFWGSLTLLALCLLKVQHDRYPDTNFFHRSYFEGYFVYSEKPANTQRLLRRWRRVVPHVFLFDVVAPVPLFTGPPDRITTFMWERRDQVARYSPLGGVLAAVWGLVTLAGTFANARGLLRRNDPRRGVRLLALGWIIGTLGLFSFFGDDLMLYSELWASHVVLWVALGLSGLDLGKRRRAWQWGAGVFVAVLAINNVDFVRRMTRFYQPGAVASKDR